MLIEEVGDGNNVFHHVTEPYNDYTFSVPTNTVPTTTGSITTTITLDTDGGNQPGGIDYTDILNAGSRNAETSTNGITSSTGQIQFLIGYTDYAGNRATVRAQNFN